MVKEKHGLFKVNQKIFLFNSKKEILMVEHNSGRWLPPGGRLNEGEDWEEGLRRETMEELGFEKFNIDSIHAIRIWRTSSPYPYYGIIFIGTIGNKIVPKPDGKEIINYAWVNLKNIDDFNFWNKDLKNLLKNTLEKNA